MHGMTRKSSANRRSAFFSWGLALASLAVLMPGRLLEADETHHLELSIVYPDPGSEVDPSVSVFFAGHAFLDFADSALDAVIIIDTSASTGMPSGEDLDRNGSLDRAFAGHDSILTAELAAAERLARELALPGNRVGLVTFSAARPDDSSPRDILPAADLVTPPVPDLATLLRGLDTIRSRLPDGMTDTAAALNESRRSLARDSGSGRGRIVLLFSDGEPTAPHASRARNLQAAVEAAALCADLGIRIHTFAVGPEALANPEALVLIAERTRGFFTPVDRISELPNLASQVARGSVRELKVLNRTTGEPASDLLLGNDGSWSALVSARPGLNVIEVSATTLGGGGARHELTILAREGAENPMPDALKTRHAELLEQRLLRLRSATSDLAGQLRKLMAARFEQLRARSKAPDRKVTIEVDPASGGSDAVFRGK